MSEMSGMPSRNSTPASPSATSAPKSRKLCQKASRAKLHASTAPMTTPFQTTGLRHARTRIAADGIAPVRRASRPHAAAQSPAQSVASEPKTTSSIPAAEIMFASAQPRNRPTDVYGKKTGSTHSASEIRNCRLP